MTEDVNTSVNARIPARPTTYKGVKMRSRLEAAYAEQFDAFGWKWEYEPECFATSEGQYLPDFRLTLNPDLADEFGAAHTYVEVKPCINWDQELAAMRMLPQWWRITRDNDPRAVAFILAFGAGAGEVLRWWGLIAEWNSPRSVCPAVFGNVAQRVSISSDIGKSSFSLACVSIPKPVASLYAREFETPIWREEDPFALRVGGC